MKALMMLWVVWGHLGLWGIVAQEPGSLVRMANAKIGVNMPIFFVLGGYLALSTFEKGSWSKIVARIVGFLWPMAAFGVVFALALVLTGNGGGIQWFLQFPIQRVHHGHWFLWTFATVYLLSALIYRIGRTDRVRWVGFALLYAVLLFLPSRFQHLLHWVGDKQTIHMLPYFVFGLMLLRKREWWHSNLLSLLSGAFFLFVVFLEGNSTTNGMNFWRVSTHWRAVFLNGHNLLCFFARTAVGITGSVFVLWAVDRLLRLAPCLSALAVFGTTSLGVYVLHEWPMMQVGRAGFPPLPFPEWTRWSIALVWFLACHFIVLGIRRFSFFRFMFFGDEKHLATVVNKLLSLFQRQFPKNIASCNGIQNF
ncbi:MAG: acyltransferase [Victivallales bacterium]|nr:acyltransferase [Victivallales bacterium]